MAYITYDQYIEYFGQPTITEEEFPIYANIATDIIDELTEGRITELGGLEAFPVLIQTLVAKACGAEVMYLAENGIETAVTGQIGAGYTVGKVHIDGSTGSTTSTAQLIASPFCMMYLSRTGLLYRGTPVYEGYIC